MDSKVTRITPQNSIEHTKLELRVTEWLQCNGWFVGQGPYHESMPKDVQVALGKCKDPTSIYIRSRADRVAVRTAPLISFQFECKTRTPNSRPDMKIEAMPLATHRMQAKLGIRCLYIYRDCEKDIECAFWNISVPPIQEIKIPPGNEGAVGILSAQFVGIPINPSRLSMSGSNDPFAIINFDQVRRLRHWTSEIADYLAWVQESVG